MKGFLRERLAGGVADFFSVGEGLPAVFGLLTADLPAAFPEETGAARVDKGLAAFLPTVFFVATDFFVADFAGGAIRTGAFLADAVLPVTFLATFFAAVFLPTGFFATALLFKVALVAFFVSAFLATDFFAKVFFAVALLLAVDFFVTDFLAGFALAALVAADFLATAFFAGFADAVFAATFFLAIAFFAAGFFIALVVVFLLLFFVAMMSPRIGTRRRSVLDALPERMTARIVHWYAWLSVMTRWRWTCAERAARNGQVSVRKEGRERPAA